jgi:hypothetical protein
MEFVNRLKNILVVGAAAVMLTVPVAASLMLDTAPAQAQTSAKSVVDCGTQIGYSPFCHPYEGVVTAGKYSPGSGRYCYAEFNASSNQTVTVAAHALGHKLGRFKKIGFNTSKWVCASFKAGTCPRVNLLMRSGDLDTNLGTFPSCTSWHLPTTKAPNFRLCRTNKSDKRMSLDLYRNGTLMEGNIVDPGKRACVSQRFNNHHTVQHLRVRMYAGRGTTVTSSSILTDAVYHRLIAA